MLVVISILLLLVIFIFVPSLTCFINLTDFLPEVVGYYLDYMNLQICYGKAELIVFLCILGFISGSFIAKNFGPLIGINFSKSIKKFISANKFYKFSNIHEIKKIGSSLFWLEYLYKFLKLLSGTVNFELLSKKHLLNIFPNKVLLYIFSPGQILQIGAFLMIFSLGMQISNVLFIEKKSKIKNIFKLFIKNKKYIILFILFFATGSWDRYLIVISSLFMPSVYAYLSYLKIYRPYFTLKQFSFFMKLLFPLIIALCIINPWFFFTRLNQSYTLNSIIEKKDEIYFKSSLDLILRGNLNELSENSEGNSHGKELGVVIPGDDATGFGVTFPGDIYISSFPYPKFLVFCVFTFLGFLFVLFENFFLNSINGLNLAVFSILIIRLPLGFQTQLWINMITIFITLSLTFFLVKITRLRWK